MYKFFRVTLIFLGVHVFGFLGQSHGADLKENVLVRLQEQPPNISPNHEIILDGSPEVCLDPFSSLEQRLQSRQLLLLIQQELLNVTSELIGKTGADPGSLRQLAIKVIDSLRKWKNFKLDLESGGRSKVEIADDGLIEAVTEYFIRFVSNPVFNIALSRVIADEVKQNKELSSTLNNGEGNFDLKLFLDSYFSNDSSVDNEKIVGSGFEKLVKGFNRFLEALRQKALQSSPAQLAYDLNVSVEDLSEFARLTQGISTIDKNQSELHLLFVHLVSLSHPDTIQRAYKKLDEDRRDLKIQTSKMLAQFEGKIGSDFLNENVDFLENQRSRERAFQLALTEAIFEMSNNYPEIERANNLGPISDRDFDRLLGVLNALVVIDTSKYEGLTAPEYVDIDLIGWEFAKKGSILPALGLATISAIVPYLYWPEELGSKILPVYVSSVIGLVSGIIIDEMSYKIFSNKMLSKSYNRYRRWKYKRANKKAKKLNEMNIEKGIQELNEIYLSLSPGLRILGEELKDRRWKEQLSLIEKLLIQSVTLHQAYRLKKVVINRISNGNGSFKKGDLNSTHSEFVVALDGLIKRLEKLNTVGKF